MNKDTELTRSQLISLIERQGYPKELGIIIADTLKTEKQMKRMMSYLLSAKPNRVEDVVDEMISIKEDFERYRQRKMTEYYNAKNNEYYNGALDIEDNSDN